jgi:hypothetical protein
MKAVWSSLQKLMVSDALARRFSLPDRLTLPLPHKKSPFFKVRDQRCAKEIFLGYSVDLCFPDAGDRQDAKILPRGQ